MNQEPRQWRDIDGFPGYFVSNDGLVKSTERTVLHQNRWGKADSLRTVKERVLKLQKTNDGYTRITMSVSGKPKREFVHRLVAKSFICNPLLLEQVNHKNGIRDDNSEHNLEWVTCGQNHEHAYRVLDKRSRTQKLTKDSVRKIREIGKSGVATAEYLSSAFGTTPTNIYYILAGKTWKNVT